MSSARRHSGGDFSQRVHRAQAMDAFGHGDFRLAFRLGSDLLKRTPKDIGLTEMVGLSAVQLEYGTHAERLLKRVVKGGPERSDVHLALGDALLLQGRLDRALEAYDRALALDPGARRAAAGKATVLELRGRCDEAADLIRSFIEGGDEDSHMAVVWATIEQSRQRFDTCTELLAKHLASPATALASRRRLCQLAARAFEKTRQFDRAFAAFEASNRVIERPFDAEAYVARIDDLIGTFSAQNLRMLPRARERSERPIFIACMPRSGSTLCEQIIHAHPHAFGAGEITEVEELVSDLPGRLDSLQPYPACLGDWTQTHADELAGWYGRELDRYDRRARRVVNKHLDNDLHLGMIALICPGARVIHCRRHPVDNGLSIFMAAMNPEKYPWATRLDHIGLAYREHERLMAHWREVLDLEILDVEYEAVVADPETEIRRLVGFVGLPWDERCLRSHQADRDVTTLSYDQVRRPIYKTAVKRYEKYAAHLGPLRDALGWDEER